MPWVPPTVILKFVDGGLVRLKDVGGELIKSGCELQFLCMKLISGDKNRKYFINDLKAFLLDKSLYTNEEYFTYMQEMRAGDVI
jgi:hypothetical protein